VKRKGKSKGKWQKANGKNVFIALVQ